MVGAVVTRSVLKDGRGRARAALANESATAASRRTGVVVGGVTCARAVGEVAVSAMPETITGAHARIAQRRSAEKRGNGGGAAGGKGIARNL